MLKQSISAMAVTGVLFSLGVTHTSQADVLKTREPQTTSTGATFFPDDSHPELGNAWRDPSGMIWGDIVRESDSAGRSAMVWMRLAESHAGRVSDLNQEDAADYCESIGASLPSQEDFNRLRGYMGRSQGAYLPQILPNLDGKTFWSSNASDFASSYWDDDEPRDYQSFYGTNSSINPTPNNTTLSVRCVTR